MKILLALAGTTLTWALTALGSALVFIVPQNNKELEQKILDASLGFAGGVMLAASYWSLLAPAIEMATEFSGYSENLAFIPAAIGFFLGALFVSICDKMMPESLDYSFLGAGLNKENYDDGGDLGRPRSWQNLADEAGGLRRRFGEVAPQTVGQGLRISRSRQQMKRRMLLLVVAITVHNFPEGLAVGVGFGAVGVSKTATLQKAWNLAIGIGIQNFPEGFAVSMPLHRAGLSKFRSFWIGQLSGLVEPIAGVMGAYLVTTAQSVLPYSLGFAAGAMVFVVVNDLIPEAHKSSNSALATWGAIIGFLVMMSLDVGFG